MATGSSRPAGLPDQSGLTAAYSTLTRIPESLLARDRRSAILDGAGTSPGARVLKIGGRPEILFIGQASSKASAVERWVVAVALSQFGRLSGGTTTEVRGSGGRETPTFLFDGVRFSGAGVAFKAVELRYRGPHLVTRLSPGDQQVWERYDPSRTVPWIDLGGPTAISGSQVPDKDVVGHSFAAIVSALPTGRAGAAFAIDGAAGALVSQLCEATGQSPAKVCRAFKTGDG